MISDNLRQIYRHTANHREEVLQSSRCCCVYCGRDFNSADIDEWVDDGQTAVCPHCGIDAVLGDSSGYDLTPKLLKALHLAYF